jgi:porin
MRHPLFIAIACLFAAAPLRAEDTEAPPNFAEDTLSGDWDGARTRAAQAGFLFEGGLKVDTLRNRGAGSNGTRTVSHLDLKAKLDLEKAVGWEGGSAMINVISDAGRGPNARHVGGLMGVTNIEVGAPTSTRLFQAWVQQSLFDDKLAVLAGLYPIDSEFFTMDSAGVFLGPQYGTPADLAQTKGGTGPSIFNNSAFGVRARWNVTPAVYAMGAVLDGVPNDPARPRRTAIRFAKGDGSFSIAEFGWLPEAGNDKFKGHAKAALGLWGYSARQDDQLDVANIDAGNIAGPAELRRSRGGYVLGERTLLQLGGDAERYLSAFARYTWTDGNSTALASSLNLGVHVKGPVASRPDDIIGLAWTRGRTAAKWRDAQVVGGGDGLGTESILEVTYRYAVTPYFAIQPNFQRIRQPGAVPGTPNTTLIGARFDLAL